MNELRRVLVGVARDPAFESAWAEARGIARTFGAELHLLHAIPDAPEHSPDFGAVSGAIGDELERLREEAVREGIAVSPRVTVRAGDAADVIVAAAAELDADLIVIGAGELTALDRVLLGSTAERVTRAAARPVWLVRPGRPHPELRRIICAVDASAPAREALATALFLARSFVARLELLTVAPPGDDPAAEEALRACVAGFDLHGVEHELVVRRGKPAVELLEAADRSRCDLLVLGEAGRKGLSRLVRGNTAEKILRVVPCSLLTVPAPARS